jgi:DNA-binding NarL/FixJ family response regulator
MTNKILVGIYDEHFLLREGLGSLLKNNNDIEVVLKASSRDDLFKNISNFVLHVLVINVHSLTAPMQNLIFQLGSQYPKLKLLALSVYDDEEIVLRSIKAGVKGFLAKDTEPNDLVEAIYTLRNGFDYYSHSITHILVNKYLSKLKTNDGLFDSKNLSSRETEILKMWGNSFTNKEIADKLFISVRTVESHKNHIMQKLNLKTTVDLVKFAIKNNIIEV